MGRRWRTFLGVLLSIPAAWPYVKGILEAGEHIEFIAHRIHDYERLGPMIERLPDVSQWIGVPLLIAGLGLIWWDTRRRQKPVSEQSRAREKEEWPLRDLFFYLAPNLPLTAHRKTATGGIIGHVDERWEPIGATVLKQLSLGRLHASGRQLRETKRLHAAPIPSEFWRDAKFTYWFLDEGLSVVQDAFNSKNDSYSEIEVDRTEAMAIWPGT